MIEIPALENRIAQIRRWRNT